MHCDVQLLHMKPFRNRRPFGLSRKLHIENALATYAVEMAMLGHIRAKMCRAAVQGHLPDQPTLYQGIETVINCRHRNLGHSRLSANKYLLSRWMIPLIQQYGINVVTLRRESKPATRQAIIQIARGFSGCSHQNESNEWRRLVNTWNNSKFSCGVGCHDWLARVI